MGSKCEWCGEPANDEQGGVTERRNGAYHRDCRIAYLERHLLENDLRTDLRVRVKRLVMMFEADVEATVEDTTELGDERDRLDAFIEYVRGVSVDTLFDLTSQPLHNEGKVRL